MIDKETLDKVFKNYDIRADATLLSNELGYHVAKSFALHRKFKTCLVAHDNRNASPRLTRAVVEGLMDAGVHVHNADIMSTAQIKWVCAQHNYEAAIMVTASHNPAKDDGFKFFVDGGNVFGQAQGLHELKDMSCEQERVDGGSVTDVTYLEEYAQWLVEMKQADERMVLIDTSAGTAGREVRAVIEQGNYDWVLFNSQEDGDFPAHSPNPLKEESTEMARTYCALHKCIGLVVDADSDRVVFIDEEGRTVKPDIMGAWLCKHVLKQGEGTISTVRDTRAIRDYTHEKQGEHVLAAVGVPNMYNQMKEKQLAMAFEKSGHILFRAAHYAESPIYCLLLVLTHLDTTLAESLRPIRETYLCSDETNVHVSDKEKLLAQAAAHYAERGALIELDGMLCEGEGWWVSMRASNTEPYVRITWEARDQETYNQLKEEALGLAEPFIAN